MPPASTLPSRFTRTGLPVLAALMVLAWPLLPVPMRYQVNDDLAIRWLLAQDTDCVFLGFLPGRLLRLLHRLLGSGAPVYPALLVACLAACAAVFAAVLARLRPAGLRDPAHALALALHAAVMGVALITPTFTLVAAAVCAHGILLVLAGTGRRSAVAGGLFAGLGAVIRLECLVLAALVLAVPALHTLLARPGRRALARLAAAAGLSLLPPLADLAASRLLASPAHLEFARFNLARGLLHDFPIMQRQRHNDALLRANGWDDDDYLLFSQWFFHDERRFNLGTMRNFHRIPPPPAAPVSAVPAVSAAERVRRFLLDRSHFTGAALWLLALAATAPCRRQRALLALHAAVLLSLGAALDANARFPVRVRESILVAAALGAAILRLGPASGRAGEGVPAPSAGRARATAAVCALMLAWRGGVVLDRAATTARQGEEFAREAAELNRRFAGRRVCFWPGLGAAPERGHPFRPSPLLHHDLLYGWTTFSPAYYRSIHDLLGVTRGTGVLRALATRSDVVFAAPRGIADVLARVIQRDTGLRVRVVDEAPLPQTSVWRLEPDPDP